MLTARFIEWSLKMVKQLEEAQNALIYAIKQRSKDYLTSFLNGQSK